MDDPNLMEQAMYENDVEFENEIGYNLVKALRGQSAGRKLRRTLFKFGLVQLICGFALLVITIQADDEFEDTRYLNTAKYGATVQDLLWCVSIPTFFFGIATLTVVRYWPSMVTNRELLANFMRLYMASFALIFVFVVWTICAVMLHFGGIDDWNENAVLASLRPYYISLLIFLWPYVVAVFLYSFEISALTRDIDMGQTIAEPDPPDDVMDLTDVTIQQACLYTCAMPCIICIQCIDLTGAVGRAYNRQYEKHLRSRRDENVYRAARSRSAGGGSGSEKHTSPVSRRKKKKGKGLGHRLYKTLSRWFSRQNPSEVAPDGGKKSRTAELQLRDLHADREQEEREQREALQRALESEQARRAEEERIAREKQEEQDLEMAMREKEKADRQLLLQLQEEAERRAREEAEEFPPTMTVQQFKALWSSLPTAGSFQCKLKSLPQLPTITEHLRKQGFHIVFAASPNSTDCEIGVCNIRTKKSEAWFMARFLATPVNFSAVMKAEDKELVTIYVKKFALAKVLRIDAGVAATKKN